MRFEWDQLIRYGPDLLQAFGVTIIISAISLVIGIALGLIACLGKTYAAWNCLSAVKRIH